MNNSDVWGYSFLGVSLGILSVFGGPLIFKCMDKKQVYLILPWFACYGSGAILALIFNHNLVDVVESLSFNWKTGSVFLSGVITSYITTFFFTTDDHCCELENIYKEAKPECCVDNISTTGNHSHADSLGGSHTGSQSDSHTGEINIPNEHSVKHWVISLLIGDSFCNFSDGILITSAFSLCGHSLGWLTTLAVVLHELSHEIGDFAIILSSGIQFKKAVLYNFLSASVSYIGWILVNSLNYLDTTHTISAYLVLYGSGVLTSLILKMLPKYIKHKNIVIQRLRIIVIIFGMAFTTLMFSFIPHCEVHFDNLNTTIDTH